MTDLRSLTETFDTKSPIGQAMLGMFAGVAEEELVRLKARTRTGMAIDLAQQLLSDGKGKAGTARAIGVDPATLRRYFNQR